MKYLPIVCSLALATGGAHAANIVLSDENFDDAPVSGNGLVGTQNLTMTTTVGDPTMMGHGNVGSVDIEPGGRWGEIRGATTQDIPLPAGTVAGTDTFLATIDIFVPSGTTFSGTDRFGIIIRWNVGNTGNSSLFQAYTNLTPDTWETVMLSGTIPATGSDGMVTVSATPIISFDDQNDDSAAGVAAYIDNWNLSVTGTIPEPATTGLLAMAGLSAGLLVRRRRV